jgi:hypothetical protein
MKIDEQEKYEQSFFDWFFDRAAEWLGFLILLGILVGIPVFLLKVFNVL